MGVVGLGVVVKLGCGGGYPSGEDWESDRGRGLGSDWGIGGGPTVMGLGNGLGCAGLWWEMGLDIAEGF